MLRRDEKTVFVPAAQSMGAIGVIRSLGAAGYKVHAGSSDNKALGLKSNYANRRIIHPPLSHPDFADWFRHYVDEQNVQLIIPGGGISLGGKPVFSQYAHLFPTSHDEAALDIGRSKYDLFGSLEVGEATHRANLPPYLRVELDAPLPEENALAALGLPLFIKLDGRYAIGASGSDVRRCETASDALGFLRSLQGKYRKVLVQGYVEGRGTGAFILRWEGATLARFMHRRIHEVPHTGGASSLRESWWHEAMMQDAEAKLARTGWQGVGMVEYRWDPATDKFALMEMNLRFWGSLHLALYAGVDFPRLLADAFFGELPDAPVTGKAGVVCRNTFPNEISHLVSLLKDPSVPFSGKVRSLAGAIALSLDPRVKTDLWYPGDRLLYMRRLAQFLRDPVHT